MLNTFDIIRRVHKNGNLTIYKALSQAAKKKQQLTLRWDFLGGNFLEQIF
jgi:hypothetical protein